MCQALLLGIPDRPRVEREEDSTTDIKIVIQREDIQGGWRFIGQVLGK